MPDRTLPPTARRLERALRSGDVPVSRVVVAAGAMAALLVGIGPMARVVMSRFGDGLSSALAMRHDPARATRFVIDAVVEAALPACAAMAAAAVALTFAQTGASITWGRPRGGAPPAGSRALGVFAAGGALLLGAAIMAIAVPDLGDATRAPHAAARDALSSLATLGFDVACAATLMLAAWAALDLVATRAAWRARLKMTPVERRQEERDLYGDPAIRRARAEAQRDVNTPRG